MDANGTVRFGIIGTGGIARDFATDLVAVDGARLVAVRSRSQASADRFRDAFDVPHGHPTHDALVADDEVDAVYVATPHPLHAENALAAIVHGKHVLVEKPFTMDAAEARRVVDAARSARVFCLEAMWTRFLPHTVRIRQLLADGALGRVTTVVADHGQYFVPDAAHRVYAPELGGGALLDPGLYPGSWAHMVFGPPWGVPSGIDPAFAGVDGQVSAILEYGDD